MKETRSSCDVLVIGGGVAGTFLSSLLGGKRKVTLLESDSKDNCLAKRIKVSGNGRCNFFNEDFLHPESCPAFLSEASRFLFASGRNYASETLSYLTDRLGIVPFCEGRLYYPFFNRSECVHSPLLEAFERSSARLIHGRAVFIDRKGKTCRIENGEGRCLLSYEDVVLCCGGRSYDRDAFPSGLLPSLDIPFYPFTPSLCPVRVKEKIPSYLVGNRLRGTVSFFADGRLVQKEAGEVLFKEDGLSGICIFNLSLSVCRVLRKRATAQLSFSIDYASHDGANGDGSSLSSFPFFLRRYLSETGKDPFQPLEFTFSSLYPFRHSQASFGGIDPSLFDEDFTLRSDPTFHALGEVLDVNFPCGGYNIGFALIGAYRLSERLRR